jgi:hypothetical protein
MRRRIDSQMGIFSQVARVVMHECNVMRTIREDGSVEDSTLKSAVGEFAITRSEAPSLPLGDLLARLNETADSMAGQMHRNFFESLNATLDNAGQVVDAKGGGLTMDLFLETLNKIQMEFDEQGKPKMALVIHPDTLPQLQELEAKWRDDPEFNRRHTELMNQKRQEWRAREASRKLVG